MSSIPVISLSTNSVSFLPFTRILLLIKYRLIVYAGCSCSCTRIVVCTLLHFTLSALKKKLDATKHQQNVLYEYTKGGLVITADAATFELLRTAANI
jgi:hypothetical protein